MIVYIAGPMTGVPEFNYPAFFAAEEKLTAAGFKVLNPARYEVVPGKRWEDYMRDTLGDVLDAEGIALLPGWGASRGANVEVFLAQTRGIPVKPLEEWLSCRSG